MDEKLMQRAKVSVIAKKLFRLHIISYICVNFVLVVIYFLTSMGGYFWPVWCIAGWGLGLLAHGLFEYRRSRGKTLEEEVQIEYRRLKSKEDSSGGLYEK